MTDAQKQKQSAIVDATAYLERHDVMVIRDGKPRFLHELVRAELAAKDEALRMAKEAMEEARRSLFYSMTQDRSDDAIWKTIERLDAAIEKVLR